MLLLGGDPVFANHFEIINRTNYAIGAGLVIGETISLPEDQQPCRLVAVVDFH